MICYKDMKFCPYWEHCADGKDCRRALTKEVEEGAKKAGLPYCVYCEKPECFKER